MKEKDIKTKSAAAPKTVKNTPKMAVKSKEAVASAVKDVKTAMKNNLVKQTMEKQLSEKAEQRQSERPENYAVDNIENAASSTADTAYHKGKTFVQNRIKAHNRKAEIRKSELPQTPAAEYPADAENISPKLLENQPKTAEHYRKSVSVAPKNEKAIEQVKKGAQEKVAVKTKAEYLKRQSSISAERPTYGVKTKENYIQEHTTQRTAIRDTKQTASGHATTLPDQSKSPKQARQEYVSGKLKTKAEYINARKPQAEMPEKPEMLQATYRSDAPKAKAEAAPKESAAVPSEKPKKTLVKTKENYMQSLRESKVETVKSPYTNAIKSKETVLTARRSTTNSKKALKTRDSVVGKSKSIIKSGNAYTGSTAKVKAAKTAKTAKTAKKAAKTQKEVTKKAAKEAAKRAKQAAQKAAQTAKAATKAAVRITVKVAQLVAAAVTKLVSALVALGGWAVLIVVLIVIIIVAAIAASPFGIFISEEAADPNSIPISSIVAECNMELSNQLDSIENGTAHDRVVMEGEQASWDEVIALFAVKVAGTEDETAQDVVIIDEAKKEILKQVFWDMHSLSSYAKTTTSGEGEETVTETVLYITINTKTKDDMIAEYGFTDNQQEALATLLENSDVLIASSQSLTISDGTAKGVLDALPENLSEKRKAVIKAACSLVGKVNYFWGGKSSAIGWDSEWGKLKLVTAEGSKSTGTKRPFGLDCSGFVTWAYINSGFSASQIGHGTQGQIAKCTRISWDSAQPGDLAFLSDLSHVGIVAGKDENGNILVIHCSSGANNVVITTISIFGFAARPGCI